MTKSFCLFGYWVIGVYLGFGFWILEFLLGIGMEGRLK
jgi:hypothetical protein